MKRTIKNTIAILALVAGLASCAKDNFSSGVERTPDQKMVPVTIGASFTATKTSMAQNGDVFWSEGDQISVKAGEESATLTISEGVGTKSGKFTGSVAKEIADAIAAAENLEATYPASGAVVPKTQKWVDTTFATETFPMVGTGTEEGGITFTASAAVLLLEEVPGGVTSAVLKKGGENLVTIEGMESAEGEKDIFFVVGGAESAAEESSARESFTVVLGEEGEFSYHTNAAVVNGSRYKLHPADVRDANEQFEKGNCSVRIYEVGEEKTLNLPATEAAVSIEFANPDDIVKVAYREGDAKPETVNIFTNDVTKFEVKGIGNVVWLVDNQAALANALNNATPSQTVALASDIEMTEDWVSVYRGDKTPNFDGRNHVISNMTIKTEEDAYVGLFRTILNHVTLQNVTFKNARLLIPDSVGEHARGGVLVGHMYPSDVFNCHVDGATIVGCQKLGGLIGYVEGDAANASVTVKDCSVKDVSISSNREGKYLEHGVGGFIGHVSLSQANLITIENNSIENVTITGNKPIDQYSKEVFIQLVPHIFIGNVCQTYQGDGEVSVESHSVVLKNNKILGENTVLPTCIYSSEYFGWGGNAEERPAWKGKIYIDGVEWTPNYPIKNVTKGTSYPTLAKAVTAASKDDRITLENGVYELPGLSNITLEGIGDNVVASNTVSGTSNVTLKNFIINFPNGNYKGFQHASNLVLDSCSINGLITTYGSTTFKKCTFNVTEYAYNMNAYGVEIVCDTCVFNGKGKAVYVYNEGSNGMYHISFNNCEFNEVVGEREKCKAAILVKKNYPNQKYVVNINGCTANFDKYVPGDPDMTGTPLWNMEIGENINNTDVKVYVDDVLMYDNAFLGIANKLALKNFADAVNAGKTFSGQTVTLLDDIDLAGETWTPIGGLVSYPSITFAGVFDGNGKKISNLTCTEQTTNYACAGLFGSLMGTVKNVTLEDVNIVSSHYAGGICAYSSSSATNVENCKVIGGTITSAPELLESGYDNGDKVGGIFGYKGETGSIKGCTVENLTIRAYRDLGGIVGAGSGTISDCTVKNTTIIQDNTNGYKEEIIDTYGEIFGRDLGGIISKDNTVSDVSINIYPKQD